MPFGVNPVLIPFLFSGAEILNSGHDNSGQENDLPILGFYQSQSTENAGRIVVYGDSNCIDSAHLTKDCWWLMDAILEYTSMARLPGIFQEEGQPAGVNPTLSANAKHQFPIDLPQRMDGNRLHRFSKVLDTNIGQENHVNTRILPACPTLNISIPEPLNKTAPSNLYKSQKLLLLDSFGAQVPGLLAMKKSDQDFMKNHQVDDWLGDLVGKEPYEDDFDQMQHHPGLSLGSLTLIFVVVCVFCYFTYKFCRHKRRQWRARILLNRKRLLPKNSSVSNTSSVNVSSSSPGGVSKNNV